MRLLLTRLRSAARLVFGWRAARREDDEAREEMRFHVDMQAEQLRGGGLSPNEARRRAELAFGGVTTWAELARDEYRWRPLEELSNDTRYAMRALVRVPSFTMAVVLSLAIGIGAMSAAYTVTDRVLIRPLSYQESGRILSLWTNDRDKPTDQGGSSFPDYTDWITDNRDIEAAAAFNVWQPLLDGDTPQPIGGAAVTSDYFRVLGVRPMLGRTFSAAEATDPASRVVVVSYEFWKAFLRDVTDPIGTSVKLGGQSYAVIGVLPAGLRDPERWLEQPTQLWRPLILPPGARQRGTHFLKALVRLRPGVTIEQARQHFNTIAARLAMDYPRSNGNRGVYALPLQEQIVGPSRLLVLAALGASICVLLIACANVATLVHARQAVRLGELALRKAIGADVGRLLRLLIAESLLLGVAGAVGGVAIAYLGTALLRRFAPADLPRVEEIVPDARVLVAMLLITIGTVLLFGLRPALVGARTDPALLLQDASAHQTRRRGARSIIVSLEIALAFVLMALTGLLTRSLMRVNAQDLGLDANHVASFDLLAPAHAFNDAAAFHTFSDRLIDALRNEPGIIRAASTSESLLGAGGNSTMLVGSPSQPHDPGLDTRVSTVSPDYFATTGIRVLAGREFTVGDSANAERVAILNRSAAEVLYPGEKPLGLLLLHHVGDRTPARIVGIVDDARIDGPLSEVKAEVYEPDRQSSWGGGDFFVVRTNVDPAAVLPAIRRVVKQIAPTVAITDAHPLTELAARFTARQRFYGTVFGIFALIGLVLASIGIYGLVAYTVVQRRREIAIRSALGATAGRVVARFVQDALITIGAGLIVGMAGAVVSSRVVQSLLFDVSATDPIAIGGGALILLAVGLVATLLPAIPATSAPIVDVLRSE
ncbi:MAG TPA: ABC transporter permease [Gemmatimonadaceae bacterium]|jgi:putative ABC transport system permease protein